MSDASGAPSKSSSQGDRSEARYRACEATLQGLAEFETQLMDFGISDLVSKALGFINERIGGARASVALINGSRSGFRIYDVHTSLGGIGKGHLIPRKSTVLSEVIEVRLPVYRPDIAAWHPTYKVDSRLLEAGLRADFLVPLVVGGRCLGTLNCGAQVVDGIAEDHRTFLTLLAPRLAQALVNAHLVEEKRTSEEKYRDLVATIPDGIQVNDSRGTVTYASPALERIFGVAPGSLVGTKIWDRLPTAEERHSLRETLQRLLIDQPAPTLHLSRNRTSSGEIVDIATRWRYVRNETDRVTGFISVLRDVTQSVRKEEELARMQNLESVGKLAGGIAHDFNNILASVMGGIQLVQMDLDATGEAASILADALQGCHRAADLTKQMLTFARGGSPIRQPDDLEMLVRACAGFALKGVNVSLAYEVIDDLLPVNIDAGQIGQVIQNLLLNAEQAMPEGGTITIAMENLIQDSDGHAELSLRAGSYVRMAVRDTGVGISAEDLPLVFDPFFTTKKQGSGLGLAACYSIVQKHDGLIRCDSQLGQGSTFEVFLPAIPAALPAEPAEASELRMGEGRILLMDDDVHLGGMIGKMIKRLGYELDFVQDGALAVERYREAADAGRPFAMVVLDLTVPGGMGGKEAAKRLLALNPEVKMIVSSGYSNDPIMANFADFGFRGVLTKPYTVLRLGKILDDVRRGPR